MKKLWNEFKAFINRGSVLDLAVGMIIGGAFTAIITALVTGILKPLINMIPLGNDGQSLQVILKDPVLDSAGNIVKEAVIMDFGAVISAVITFLLTALVLFAVIKVINTAKAAAEKEKAKLEALVKKDDKKEAPVEEVAPVEEPAPVVEAPAEPNKTEELLTAILEELKSKKAE